MLESLDHSDCLKNENHAVFKNCQWPRYHACLEELKVNKFRGVEIANDFESKAFSTKLAKKQNEINLQTSPESLVKTCIEQLVKRLDSDIRSETFEAKTVEIIEMTRNVVDVGRFAILVKDHGAVQTSLKIGGTFVSSVRAITSSVQDISDSDIKENFTKFLKVLEQRMKLVVHKNFDSKAIIKEFLASPELYSGIELSLHCMTASAVKVSVESVVESLVSRYENHFDASRQLDEDHALEEMFIAENGPNIVHADKLLISAMNRYWKDQSKDGGWHFCHKSDDLRLHLKPSKTVQKHLNVQVKLPFMTQ